MSPVGRHSSVPVVLLFTLYSVIDPWTARAGTAMDRTPAFSPQESYRDIFPITGDNFTATVLGNVDPWIVVFHDGSLQRAWKTMASHLRGLCWVGVVDNTTDPELLRQIGYNQQTDTDARVYPYGDVRTKRTKWHSVRNANEARAHAMSSLPDITQRIKTKDTNDFLTDSFMSTPSRFPVYILTDEDETSGMFKALALRFKKYFNFGVVVRPSPQDLQLLGLGKVFFIVPEVFALVRDPYADDDEYKFSAIRFDKERMGTMNYTNVMQFMFAVNTQFRYALPGDNQSNQKQEAEMEDVIEIERERFQLLRETNESDEQLHAHQFQDLHESYMAGTVKDEL